MPLSSLSRRYADVRAQSLALLAPLSAEDACVQSMPDASPAKWHLAHTTWFFETFILEKHEAGFRAFDPGFRVLFNSYYNGVGDKHPRPQRGLLTRPGLDVVLAYRSAIDQRMQALLANASPEILKLVELGLHHEQQHQELMLTDIKHLFSCNPHLPAYRPALPPASAVTSLNWHAFPGGVLEIGHTGEGFCYDNETPRHKVFLAPYQLASRLVTNDEYLEFVRAGGYENPACWLAEGWDWRNTQALRHPIYWRHPQADGPWQEFTLSGLQPLDPHRPVIHLSYYEADAYARWRDARLPTEMEWEHAAAGRAVSGHFADRGEFHPAPADTEPLTQLYGDAWEWTSSSYAPYPGFRPPAGAVGEYNGKFMVNQYVLRGGSCLTPVGHIRASYRNFFPAAATWQVSGIRLARDA